MTITYLSNGTPYTSALDPNVKPGNPGDHGYREGDMVLLAIGDVEVIGEHPDGAKHPHYFWGAKVALVPGIDDKPLLSATRTTMRSGVGLDRSLFYLSGIRRKDTGDLILPRVTPSYYRKAIGEEEGVPVHGAPFGARIMSDNVKVEYPNGVLMVTISYDVPGLPITSSLKVSFPVGEGVWETFDHTPLHGGLIDMASPEKKEYVENLCTHKLSGGLTRKGIKDEDADFLGEQRFWSGDGEPTEACLAAIARDWNAVTPQPDEIEVLRQRIIADVDALVDLARGV